MTNFSFSDENFARPIVYEKSGINRQTDIENCNTLTGETLSGESFVGRNFRHLTKNSSLSPDEKFRPIKVKVSLVEVQMNLRWKKVI